MFPEYIDELPYMGFQKKLWSEKQLFRTRAKYLSFQLGQWSSSCQEKELHVEDNSYQGDEEARMMEPRSGEGCREHAPGWGAATHLRISQKSNAEII